MDDGESLSPLGRKRTESSGGSSDSELSEGWNIIDQMDVANHDVPSSDGESVEVIDADDESRGNVTDMEVEGDTRLAPVLESPVVPLEEPEVPAVVDETPREEMFDSSFRWFLIYATAAVLFSNVAFMVAENFSTWNTDSNMEAPSFLRDLPTTPKMLSGNSLNQNIPWAEREEATVEILDDRIVSRHSASKNNRRNPRYGVNQKQQYKPAGEKFDMRKNYRMNKQPIEKYKKPQNEKAYIHPDVETGKHSYRNFDDSNIRTYFNILSEATTSFETKGKLNQVVLILDALHIGLNDLEEVVTENSELQNVLNKQKHKLSQILTELEYGVSKSLDWVATNTLNKVRKLERRFEHQWCELEKRGHQDELKGLFYDCREKEKAHSEHGSNSAEIKNPNYASESETLRTDKKWDSYEYQVDKDSPGKEHVNTHESEVKEVNDYYMLVNKRLQNDLEFLKDQENAQYQEEFLPAEEGNISKNNNDKRGILDSENDKKKFTDVEDKQYYDDKVNYNDDRKFDEIKRKNFDDKEKYYNTKNYDNKRNFDSASRQNFDAGDKWKYNNGNGKHYDDKGKHNDAKRKQSDDKKRYYVDKNKHTDDRGYDKGKYSDSKRKHDDKRTFSEDKRKHTTRFETFKSTEQYPNSDQTNNRGQAKSEKSVPNPEPELIRRYLKESCEKKRNKVKNLYEKLKSFIDSKLRVPKKMFDSLFAKYCQKNDDSFKWEKRFNRENPKGDFNGKNNKNFYKDELVIEDNENEKARIVDISEVVFQEETADPASDNMILPNNQPRQWVFNLDQSLNDNRSNLTGDWFLRAGESRSKMRWSDRRGDWWFDRASHRRNHPRPGWFSSRRKNWYFRRAWARQNCRHSPHDDWCDFSDEETVTVPNPSTNFR